MTAIRAYLTKVALAFVGGAVGVLLAGLACTAWDRGTGRRRKRRAEKKAIREAELLAAMAAHPAGGYEVGAYTERNVRRDEEAA